VPAVAGTHVVANPGSFRCPYSSSCSSAHLHSSPPGGRVVLLRGSAPPLPRARRPSSIGDRSSNPTTRPRRPSAANRPPMGWLRNLGSYLRDGRAKILDEPAMWPGEGRAESDRRFQALTEVERLRVQAFLKTLVVPSSTNSHAVSLAVEDGARGAAVASAKSGTGGQPREGAQPVRRMSCFWIA